MCHRLLGDARFHLLQLKFDEDLAAGARAALCPKCGGRLDSANYPRKPRGATKLPDDYETKFSFCCATELRRRPESDPVAAVAVIHSELRCSG